MLLSWIVCIIGIIGTILNVKQNKWCFALWIVSNTCLIFLNFKAAPAQSALFTVYLATAVWGLVAWSKAEKTRVTLEEKQLAVFSDHVTPDLPVKGA